MTTDITAALSDSFQIRCQMEGNFTVAQEWAIAEAVKTWETIITADIPDLLLTEDLAEVTYRGTTYSVDPDIDDITIVFVGFSQAENPDGTIIVGSSTVSTVRTGSVLPCVSAVGINNQAISDYWLDVYWLYMHEICHALGFYSVIWESDLRDDGPLSENALWSERNNGTPVFLGENALEEYRKIHPNATSVPLETIQLSGSYGTHFLSSEFMDRANQEIDFMVYNSGNASSLGWNVSISSVVLGAMEDLGYSINYAAEYQPDLPDFYITLDVLQDNAITDIYYTGIAYDAAFTIINTTGRTIVGAELVFSFDGGEQTQLISVLNANEAVTITVSFTSQTAGTIALAGTVSSLDGQYSSNITDFRYFNTVDYVNNNGDAIETPGTFRWALATLPADAEITFAEKYNITVKNGTLNIADRVINGAGSTLYSGTGDAAVRISGETVISALSIADRYTGTESFLTAGSEVILDNVSISTKQSTVLLTGNSLELNNSVIAGDTVNKCTIVIDTTLTLSGSGNTLMGNFNQIGGELFFSPDTSASANALLSISGAILSVGAMSLNCKENLAIGTTYTLVSAGDIADLDGKNVTVNGTGAITINGSDLDCGNYALALKTEGKKLLLSVIDKCPEGAVRIEFLPDYWQERMAAEPVFAWDLRNFSDGIFYNGASGQLNNVDGNSSLATRISGAGLGTVFGGGIATTGNCELYLLIAGTIGTIFGGGDGNDGTTDKTFISLENEAKIYNLFGGGRKSDGGMTTISIASGSVNYLFGGAYQSQTTGHNEQDNAFPDAVTIQMDGGSVWKFFGGSADGKIQGNIAITVTSGAITNVFYGGGIGDVTGNITIRFEQGVDLTAAPVLYGGIQIGVSGAITSANAELEQLFSRGDRSYSVDQTISMDFFGTTIAGMVFGGNFVNADTVGTLLSGTVKGGIQIHLENASAGSWIFGGSYVKSSSSNDTIFSGVQLQINGGDYHYLVGGSRAENGGIAIVSNVQIAITGGDFQSIILAGGYANDGESIVAGNTQLIIDTSSADVTFSNSLYLGGYAHTSESSAIVEGGTTAVISGSGEQLHFTGSICGGGFGGGDVTISGKRTIEFNDFSGNFNGVMRDFDRIVFSGNTSVNLTTEVVPELFSEWYFDLSQRQTDNAVVTMKNSAEISLCATNTLRIINVGTGWNDNSGTIVLIDAVDDLLAELSGLDFHLLFSNGNGTMIEETLIVNDHTGVDLGPNNWQLACDGNCLSLLWDTASSAETFHWAEQQNPSSCTAAALLPETEWIPKNTSGFLA